MNPTTQQSHHRLPLLLVFRLLCVILMVVRSGNSAPVDDAATVGIAPAAARASKITVPTTSTAVEESEAASIKALLAQVDRLSSRLEDVTLQVQGFLDKEQNEAKAKAALASVVSALAGESQPAEAQPLERRKERIDRRESDRGESLSEEEEKKEKEEAWPLDGGTHRQNVGGREERYGGESGGSREGGWWGGGLRGFGATWWALLIFAHEVWLCLQHTNVLLNPLCQRLDRGYGIALLKRRLYWVIATVLAAYWAREVLSMLLAAPYASPLTRKMIAVSAVYHVGKILLVSLDASRGWSPTLGIMRLLMDHWHLSSVKDLLLSAKRVALQGFDTVTHALVVRDMLRWDEEESSEPGLGLCRTLIFVVVVWAIHAVGNIMTKKSTATLVVEVTKRLVRNWGRERGSHGLGKFSGVREGGAVFYGALDGGRADFACTPSCSHGHKRCEVCHLLTRDKPPSAPASSSRRKRVD